ncbi:hypothetical protein OEZ60_01485 [Defluviimonas sp. WL0024]|uniref:Uncharacterized protein n=1 Tax=Albidovulum salinarum TaxID=2984153 RepID=A0ABT2WYC2_9RHOB|nr:hypothetical protein [Defluviimonas sp. WL0024]MCU9846678.1 hypothetical protein [Defluviimonas sp. WL0024]
MRLKRDAWGNSPDRATTGRVIANFKQVVKEGELRMHPHIGGLVEPELLEKMREGQAAPSAGARPA